MKNNKKAFSLVVAIWLTIIMSLLAFFMLEYIIPFSKNIKGIENSVWAYYQAETAVEDALYFVNTQPLWTETNSSFSSDLIDNELKIIATGSVLPIPWEWNSDFDPDWNIIRIGDPIQLEIWWWWIDWSNINTWFKFRVPDLDSENNETLSWWTSPIINWQLNSNNDSLSASWTWITATDINEVDEIDFLDDSHREGRKLDWEILSFPSFYNDNCWSWSWCILKLTVISKLELDNNIPVPYIEWQSSFDSSIPLRYTNIEASWKSYGFKKDLKVKVPQQTVNEAFDFTVFQ